ncbi:COX VIb-2 [Intoshia linei]|uniref:COX VIb-2 n=1 Tax=Intoshia linei TaxID=1819745 RepID=A0A177AVZ0_9BILA|nr:COX VIb-2 [Intoshia linei]
MFDILPVLRDLVFEDGKFPIDESKRLKKEEVFEEMIELPKEERYAKYRKYQHSNGFYAPPLDNRFPQIDKKRGCYFNYLEYHRCYKIHGDDHVPCEYFKWAYRNQCPSSWYEKWDQHRNDGVFSGDWWINSGRNIPKN